MTAVETPSQPLYEANYIVTRTKRFNRGTAHVSLRFVITVRYVFLIALRTQIISSRQRNLCARVHHFRYFKWYSASEDDLIFVLLFILPFESVSSRKSYLLKWIVRPTVTHARPKVVNGCTRSSSVVRIYQNSFYDII